MAKARRPTEHDRKEALGRLLTGLVRGDEIFQLTAAIADLHPRNDLFPGEPFLHLAVDALDLAEVGAEHPIPYEGLRETFLPECQFRGRQNAKIQFTILSAASHRGGVEPDLLGEASWWPEDDFWRYALYAAVALIRAAAERTAVPVPAFAERLAARQAITVERGSPRPRLNNRSECRTPSNGTSESVVD